jgi:hypothetical protein
MSDLVVVGLFGLGYVLCGVLLLGLSLGGLKGSWRGDSRSAVRVRQS